MRYPFRKTALINRIWSEIFSIQKALEMYWVNGESAKGYDLETFNEEQTRAYWKLEGMKRVIEIIDTNDY